MNCVAAFRFAVGRGRERVAAYLAATDAGQVDAEEGFIEGAVPDGASRRTFKANRRPVVHEGGPGISESKTFDHDRVGRDEEEPVRTGAVQNGLTEADENERTVDNDGFAHQHPRLNQERVACRCGRDGLLERGERNHTRLSSGR